MDNIFKIATSISTPLAACGLILAIFFYLVQQIIKSKNNGTNPLYKDIVKYLFYLSLVALVLGFIGFIYTQLKSAPISYTAQGIVFVGGDDLSGVKVEILEVGGSNQTDSYGKFSIPFDAHLKQSRYTLKFTNKYLEKGIFIETISHDSLIKVKYYYLKRKPDSLAVAVNSPGNTAKKGGSEKKKTIIVHSPVPPISSHFNSHINFDSLLKADSEDELRLSNDGKLAFENQNYPYTIKFLERAHVIQSSRVWESNLPYLIAAYWIQDDNNSANYAINYMYKEISSGHSYLSSNTTIGFTIQNFGYIKSFLPSEIQSRVDPIVNKLVTLKNQTP